MLAGACLEARVGLRRKRVRVFLAGMGSWDGESENEGQAPFRT